MPNAPLPFLKITQGAGAIQSGSDTYLAGAWVSIHPNTPPSGRPVLRFTAEAFEKDPSGTMLLFLSALRLLFTTGRWEPLSEHGVLFHLNDGHKLYAWPDDIHFRDSEDNEAECWVMDEWGDSAEEVIGAFLCCLAAHSQSNLADLRATHSHAA